MRSALIIATFALTALATPVAEANPIFKSSEIGQNDRLNLNGHSKRQPEPFGRGSHPRDVAEEEDGDDFEARFIRFGDPEPFGRGSHPKREEEELSDAEELDIDNEQLEARFSRGSHPGRSAEPEPTVRGPRPGKRVAEPEAEAEAEPTVRGPRTGSLKPTAEPYIRGKPPKSRSA
ncbi:hypothetical protein BU23DRAFT_647158 [Bimuria novae-zelandiae CBS 107.79]|uniref:Uncharacterized protein n=1 Tax=Bimuria novae-zelandiae CBS 107.79 TaxID=1447943 RepID=A0A6A5VM22_9PLEO|nr:hypothetical protein BU23DRAFT_647158 [Bimuria novae-zelandiae CBS 107.79]